MDLLDLIRNKEQSKRLAELMRISAKKILGVVLAMAVLLISSHGLAHVVTKLQVLNKNRFLQYRIWPILYL